MLSQGEIVGHMYQIINISADFPLIPTDIKRTYQRQKRRTHTENLSSNE